MLPTRELARLVDHAARARAKLVLVGDHRQLAAIEAGGAFHALGTRLPVIELRENRRQSERWERDALELLRGGQGGEALERYGEHGRVVQAEDAEAVRQRLVADWWAARDPDRSVMIAYRRVDVRELNGRARALMRTAGALGAAELRIGQAGFAAGDRVVLRRNDRALDVCNGDRGTVSDVDPARRFVDVELRGRSVRLDARYLDAATRHGAALQHAYAITGHVAQGLTFRQTFVLGSEHISREWGYSALSRGRESNRLYSVAARSDDRDEYAPAEPDRRDPRERLAAALDRSDAQTPATDADRWQRLIEQLQAAIAEVDAASRAHDAAAAARRSIELDSPGRLRPRARRRHDEELVRARETEDRAGGRVAHARARESILRAELDQERRTLYAFQPSGFTEREARTQRLERLGLTQPERVLSRASDTGRGIEL